MKLHLQLEILYDLCLVVHYPTRVGTFSYLSCHWDPDALARWNTLMSYLVSFLELDVPAQRLLWSKDWSWEADGKARPRLK